MSADWRVAFRLTDAERELVLTRIRMALRVAPEDSPLTPVLRAFEQQVAAGDDELVLPVGRLDLVGLVHWSGLLQNLPTTTGEVRCERCRGLGTLTLPSQLVNLASQFDYDYSLSHLSPGERQPFLDKSPDPAVRERQEAERQAELEKKRDAERRAEERSYGVLAGTPRSEMRLPSTPDHIPARGR